MRDTEENLSLSFVCIQIRGLGPVWSVPLSLSLTRAHTHTHTHTQDEDTKPLSVKKEEPNRLEPKQEPMDVEDRKSMEDRKPGVKTEPKEEDEGGANGTVASTSPTQNRKKSEDTHTHSHSHVSHTHARPPGTVL